MKRSDFYYDLPEGVIAQQPAKPRDSSKLLVLDKEGNRNIRVFKEILGFVEKGDVIVINTSRVARSKLFGMKETGARAEVILLEKMPPAAHAGPSGQYPSYRCRIKTRNPHAGCRLIFKRGVAAEVVGKDGDDFVLRFTSGYEHLDSVLSLPLPPYIKSPVNDEDYQTVYSDEVGSVAAPTAGLHFTRSLMEKIKAKGAFFAEVCLHVGFGTFIPVRTKDPREHKMEKEVFSISQRAADLINKRRGRLFVVGTTSLRALESATEHGRVISCTKETDLYIYPGYRWNLLPDFFITNFHLPGSTLLLLVSAMVGRKRLLDAYRFAIDHGFRFYSLGDAMLIRNS